MDACPLCFLSRSCAVGSASAIFLATRRTNPLISDISKGNAPHFGGATSTIFQDWPFALLSEKNGDYSFSDFPAGVPTPRPAGPFSERIAVCSEKGVFHSVLHLLLLLGFPGLRAGLLHDSAEWRFANFQYAKPFAYWTASSSRKPPFWGVVPQLIHNGA